MTTHMHLYDDKASAAAKAAYYLGLGWEVIAYETGTPTRLWQSVDGRNVQVGIDETAAGFLIIARKTEGTV